MLYTIFVLINIFSVVFAYDADLRLRRVFWRRSLQKRIAYITWDAPRLFFAIADSYLKFRTEFECEPGVKLPDRFVVIGNHQSLIDIPMVFFHFRKQKSRFVSKKELGAWVPLISQVLRGQKHCLISRQANRQQSMRTLDDFALRTKAEGFCPIIFPEGTRTRNGRVGTFHAAGFRRMEELSPLPVVAVAIDGGWRLATMKEIFQHIKGARYRLRVMKVYDTPSGKAEVTSVLEDARVTISAQIDRWREEDEAANAV